MLIAKFVVLNRIIDSGLVAIIRADVSEDAARIAEACAKGGVEALEVTFTVPGAAKVIETLSKEYKSEMVIGAGTVLDPETARIAILAGAQFVVSPALNVETARLCDRYQIPHMPGTGTVKEIIKAMEVGAEIIKVFPSEGLGPGFVKAVRSPLPQAQLMPTGGVSLDNVTDWIKAGCVAVGVSGNLTGFKTASDSKVITETAKQFLTKDPAGACMTRKKNVITFGEMMLRLAAPGMERLLQSPRLEATFGGSEANVAIGLSLFGVPVSHVTVLPDQNALSEACIGELRRYGVDTSAIVRGSGRFGAYYLESGANQRPPRILYDRENSALALARPGTIPWDEIFTRAGWFHVSEITPAISPSAADVTIDAMRRAKKAGLTVSCDLNHRKNLWKWGSDAREVMPVLMQYTDIVIGNMETMDVVLGVTAKGDFKSVTRKSLKTYPNLKTVVLTRRESRSASHNAWSACLDDGKRFLESRQYEITHMIERVGGGDAFDAGLIYGILMLPSLQDALDFASATAVLKHSIPGDFSRSTVEEVNALLKDGGSGKVQR